MGAMWGNHSLRERPRGMHLYKDTQMFLMLMKV